MLRLLGAASLICALSAGARDKAKTGEPSFEMRWFYRGELPDEVRKWFRPSPQARGEERTDIYLVVAGDHASSLKLRGGELELKTLSSSADVVFAGGSMSGRGEHWLKWEWSISTAAPTARRIKGLRREVHKQRLQRAVSAGGGGCLAEVTSLATAGARWWTLAVELDGPAEAGAMERCATAAVHGYPGPPLDAAHSQSYPAWLAGLGPN
jgi:hypothetical protein